MNELLTISILAVSVLALALAFVNIYVVFNIYKVHKNFNILEAKDIITSILLLILSVYTISVSLNIFNLR